jgi:ATP-dependent Lon protease
MLPRRNEKDIEDVPADAREKLKFVLLDRVEDAVRHGMDADPDALFRKPEMAMA